MSAAAQGMSAQALSAPVAGMVLDGEGRLLSVAGVSGTLLPGQTVPGITGGQPILTAAFSSAMGAFKTASQVVIVDAKGALQSSREAPPGGALFGFTGNGTLQWACFPEAHRLQSLTGAASLDTSAWGDSVVALGAVSGSSIGALVLKGSQLWAETIAIDTGVISSLVPVRGAAPAAYFESGWLTATATGLQWQPESGAGFATEITLPAVVVSLQNTGSHSVAINSRWLLGPNWQVLEIPLAPRSRPADRPAPPAERFQ
jgi:hypothetical protein